MKKIILILLILPQLVLSQWVAINTGSTGELKKVTFINANTGFVLSFPQTSPYNSQILRTTNAGNTWGSVYTAISTDLAQLQFINSNTGFAAPAQGGSIIKTTNGGLNWFVLTAAQSGLCFIDSVNWYALTTGNVIKTTNGGLNWQTVASLAGYGFSFLNQSTGVLHSYVNSKAGAYGTNYYTTNGGTNWTQGASGGHGAFVEGGIIGTSFFYSGGGSSVSISTNSGLTWFTKAPSSTIELNIKSVQFVNQYTGYVCGTKNSGTEGFISYTTNQGASWVFSSFAPSVLLNNIFFTSELTGYVCGKLGGLFKTTTGGVVTGFTQSNSELPDDFSLSQNYPNPFNPATQINYQLPITNYVLLKVYDALGNEVQTLVNEKQNAGSYSVDFNAASLPSGIYFYKLVTEKFSETKKMILIK